MVIIKTSNKGYRFVSLNLNIDWEKKEIALEVLAYYGGTSRYIYPADEFASALEKFDELDAAMRGKQD